MKNALKQELLEYLSEALMPLLKDFYSHRIESFDDRIEVKCQITEEGTTKTLVLRVIISERHSEILIPNIFLPVSMRHQGIGKSIIGNVHRIAKKYGFRTFVVELTNSFFERLKNRGALVMVDGDVVEIVDETRLN